MKIAVAGLGYVGITIRLQSGMVHLLYRLMLYLLIDGRFRVACFVSALVRIQKPTLILFDDYKERSEYHIVERILKPTQLVGRMAIFHAVPNIDIKKHLIWMIGSFSKTT